MSTETTAPAASGTRSGTPAWYWAALGVLAVLILGAATRYLEKNVPEWFSGSDLAAAIEYPVYAIALGLVGNGLLTVTGLRERLAGGFRTEFFIKTGLVLLGASINLKVIVTAAGPAIIQGIILISLGVPLHLVARRAVRPGRQAPRPALLGGVDLRRERGHRRGRGRAGQAGAARLQREPGDRLRPAVDLPPPGLAYALGLSPAVAGAWIGGNIDTTAAVTAAGAIVGEEALAVASIVKVTQNALIGVVAVLLTAYFALRVERRRGRAAARRGRAVAAVPEVRARLRRRLGDRHLVPRPPCRPPTARP